MNYIINPAVFYWMSVLNGLKIAMLVLSATSCAAAIITLFINILNSYYDDDPDLIKLSVKIFKISAIVCAVVSIILIAIPSKDTMIQMLIAKYATYDNANWTVESLKSAVDYIVEAIKSLK